MRRISRLSASLLALAITFSLALSGGTAMAASNSDSTASGSTPPAASTTPMQKPATCADIKTQFAKAEARLTTSYNTILSNRAKNVQIRLTDRQNVTNTLTRNRAARDAKLAGLYTTLTTLANGDQTKLDAVTTFKTAVTNAIDSYRTTADTNRTTYYASIDAAVTAQNTAVDQAVATLKSADEAAVAKAYTACALNGVGASVATLKTDLTTNLTTFRATVKAANATLTESVKQAQDTFKTANSTAASSRHATITAAEKAMVAAFQG